MLIPAHVSVHLTQIFAKSITAMPAMYTNIRTVLKRNISYHRQRVRANLEGSWKIELDLGSEVLSRKKLQSAGDGRSDSSCAV